MVGRVFLGRYEATRLLGEGGMGRVFLARQIDIQRQVVVKVMHDEIAADVKFRERFKRETHLMAQFQHPFAVALYDASLDDPLGPCIIMEYVKGINLDALLARNGRFTPARVGRLLGQLCEVLQAAHDQGIMHRDLKPANLMIQDADTPREKIKVMDFGLAKRVEAATLNKITDTNVDFATGTPGYICPEQVRGEDVDHRGDLYSVGVLVYELLAGRLPFPGPMPMDMLLAHATEHPPTFTDLEITDWVPEPVEDVVMRCLSKDPAERPQSARELAHQFEQALIASEFSTVSSVSQNTPVPERGPDKPFKQTFVAAPDDPNAIFFHFDAWMPEKVALVKLRGYCHDYHGEVVESLPGMVRVRVPTAGPRDPVAGGPLSWLGLGRRPSLTQVELRLIQTDPERENQLKIEARFSPCDSTSSTDELWRARCVQHYINLRGYLMGVAERV